MNSRWIVLALYVSLALNLLMGGYLLGREDRPLPLIDPTRGYLRLLGELPEERRAALAAHHREARRAHRPYARELRAAHRAFVRTLEAEPLDEAALNDALIELREIQGRVIARGHEGFLGFVGALTPDERRLMTQALKRPRHRHHQDRRDKRERLDPPDRAPQGTP